MDVSHDTEFSSRKSSLGPRKGVLAGTYSLRNEVCLRERVPLDRSEAAAMQPITNHFIVQHTQPWGERGRASDDAIT